MTNTLDSFNFYTNLIGLTLDGDTKAGLSHVVVFGAIVGHCKGPKGCIASNEHIADEVGLSEGRTANIISEISKAGWIKVNLNELRQRTSINVMVGLHVNGKPVSQNSETVFHGNVNIDNSIETNSRDKEIYKEKALIVKDPYIAQAQQFWVHTFGKARVFPSADEKACARLIDQYGIQAVQNYIVLAKAGRADQYAPVITNFRELESKWERLEAWGMRTQNRRLNRSVTIRE